MQTDQNELSGLENLCMFFQKQVQLRSVGITINSFELKCVLGKGAYAKVLLVQMKDSSQMYALKVLKKSYVQGKRQMEHVKAERNILAELNHPFIIKLVYAFQNEKYLYFCLEYCPGGELYYLLSKQRRFKEEQYKIPYASAQFYAAQILLVIEYLHNKDIVYRDLKPENIMICQDGYIKLTDFGLAKGGMNGSNGTYSICGTAEYMAPEVLLSNQYGKHVDWWAFGCLIYEMVVGVPPFFNPNKKDLKDRIINEKQRFPFPISSALEDLIGKLLDKNPTTRLCHNIRKHQWFTINWDDILNKTATPPFLPKLNNDSDVSCFDPQFVQSRLYSPDSQQDEYDSFKDFTYKNSQDVINSLQTLSPEIIDYSIEDNRKMLKVQSTEIIYKESY